jgi:hypothetical protein
LLTGTAGKYVKLRISRLASFFRALRSAVKILRLANQAAVRTGLRPDVPFFQRFNKK